MSYDPDITKQQIFGVLAPFIVAVTGFPQDCVIQGLGNRDAMPLAAPGFVSMTSVRLRRLNYNIDTWDPTDPNVTEISSEQHVKLSIQLDVYGATSQDKAVALTTLLRDDVAVQALKPVCTPLYCEDAVMGPLDDSEQQYEERWVIELYVQYNPVVTPPVQSASVVGPVDAINVDQRYPPA